MGAAGGGGRRRRGAGGRARALMMVVMGVESWAIEKTPWKTALIAVYSVTRLSEHGRVEPLLSKVWS